MPSLTPPTPEALGSPLFWRKIERFLKNRTLIPVLGPGVITFGEEDTPFYPWLVEQLAARLHIDPVPETLHQLVCAHLRDHGQLEEICVEIDELLENPPPPGRLLRELASISQCQTFFTLGCDPLLERALRAHRGIGSSGMTSWVFSLDRATEDLPSPGQAGTVLGYLFGKVSPNPGFHLWDADAIEFVWSLQRQLPALNNLGKALAENNLLVIGTRLSDWLVRFLMRVVRQKPLTDRVGTNFLLADDAPPNQPDAVLFYESLGRGIEVMPVDPFSFLREFIRRAKEQEAPLRAGQLPGLNLNIPAMETTIPDGSIFISYSHAPTDAAAAFRLVEALRAAGCSVWLDHDRLVVGDNFENHLEDAVKKHCGFFVSVISRTTESRTEAYFHKERNWAAQRAVNFTHNRPFYFPVVIDDTPLPPRHEPREFAAIDIEPAPDGEPSDALVTRLKELQFRLMHATPT